MGSFHDSWDVLYYLVFSSSTNLFMLSKASWKGKIPFPCEAPAAPCHPAFCKRRIQTIQGRSLLPQLENVKLLDESIVICWNLSYPLNHGQSSNTLSDSNYSLISSQIIFAVSPWQRCQKCHEWQMFIVNIAKSSTFAKFGKDSQHHWSTLSLLPTMFTLTTKTISLFLGCTPAMAQLEATNWKQISPPPSPIQVEKDLFLKKKTTISRDMVIAIPNNQPKNPQLISNLLIVTPMSVEK